MAHGSCSSNLRVIFKVIIKNGSLGTDGEIAPGWMPQKLTGGRLNKKDGLTRYGDSHVKDKTS